MTLENLMEVLAYNVIMLLQDAETGEFITIANSNEIKSDESMQHYIPKEVCQIIPVNDKGLKILIIN